MLLLVEENALLESLPMDSSPALMRIIKVASPVKKIQDLSSDADLPLGQVCQYLGEKLQIFMGDYSSDEKLGSVLL